MRNMHDDYYSGKLTRAEVTERDDIGNSIDELRDSIDFFPFITDHMYKSLLLLEDSVNSYHLEDRSDVITVLAELDTMFGDLVREANEAREKMRGISRHVMASINKLYDD